jgi:hypothetical protein
MRKIIGLALLLTSIAASAQTIYRTVTERGAVVYSEDGNVKGAKESQSISLTALGGANTRDAAAANRTAPPDSCRTDTQKFCAGESNPGRAFECLVDHSKEVSDTCYDDLKQRIARQQATSPTGESNTGSNEQRACRQDAQRYCKGVQPGGGRIVNCLLDHQNDISDACYAVLEKRTKNRRP